MPKGNIRKQKSQFKMKIEIKAHSDNWKREFEEERLVLQDIFQEEIRVIEHIGSTSVPQLSAKPVIDIFLAVSHLRSISYYKNKLKKFNYRYSRTDMSNRHLFSKYTAEEVWTHNLHILPYDENFYLRNELLFRDYLRNNPDYVFKYSVLKEQLAIKNYQTIEDYTKLKSQFIQSVVDRALIEKGLQKRVPLLDPMNRST